MVIVSRDGTQVFNTYHIVMIKLYADSAKKTYHIEAETSMGITETIAVYMNRKEAEETMMRIMKGFEERARAVYLSDVKKEEPNRDLPLDSIGLSMRAYNVLRHAGFNHLSNMDGMTQSRLRKIRGMGSVTVREIVKKAEEYGMEIP